MNSTNHTMEEILDQIKGAISCKLYYSALFMTIAIPDICSALQSQNNDSDRKKYKNWFNKYIAKSRPNKYGAPGQLTADHLWNIRCSLFHQGITGAKLIIKECFLSNRAILHTVSTVVL